MSPAEAKKRIEALSAELKKHSYEYYVLAMPSISDFEFDKLLEELTALETQFPELIDPDSPTQNVGGLYHQGVPDGKAPLAYAFAGKYL